MYGTRKQARSNDVSGVSAFGPVGPSRRYGIGHRRMVKPFTVEKSKKA